MCIVGLFSGSNVYAVMQMCIPTRQCCVLEPTWLHMCRVSSSETGSGLVVSLPFPTVPHTYANLCKHIISPAEHYQVQPGV